MESNLTHTFLQLEWVVGSALPHPSGLNHTRPPPVLNSQTGRCPRRCQKILSPHAPARWAHQQIRVGPLLPSQHPLRRGGQHPMRGGPRVAGVWTFLKDQSCLDSS